MEPPSNPKLEGFGLEGPFFTLHFPFLLTVLKYVLVCTNNI